MNLEYIGGHIWSATEQVEDGYDKTIVSIEMEKGKEPWIIELTRPLTKSELEDVIKLVHRESIL